MFTYDKDSAREGSGSTGGMIDRKGDYVGHFKLVKKMVSKKGTIGVKFEFVTEEGGYCTLDLWTSKSDGTPIFGASKVHAIMCVLGLSGVSNEERLVEDYDFDLGKRAQVMRTVCPELMDKRIGIVMSRENYVDSVGNDKFKMNLVCPFNAVSKQTANEMMDNAPAAELLNIVAGLKDKTAKPYVPAGIPPGQHVKVENPNPVKEDMGDDIPF